MRSRTRVFQVVLITLLSLAAISAGQTWTVYPGGNLQAIINGAANYDSIVLTAGSYTFTAAIEVNKSLFISGTGTVSVTNTNSAASVFHVTGSYVEITGLGINSTATNGGALHIEGSGTRNINNCTLGGNATNGGALYIQGGSTTFTNCAFSGQAVRGCAVYAQNAGVSFYHCRASSGCEFIPDQTGNAGGVIYATGSSINLYNCLFLEVSTSSTPAQGEYLYCENGSLSVQASTLFRAPTFHANNMIYLKSATFQSNSSVYWESDRILDIDLTSAASTVSMTCNCLPEDFYDSTGTYSLTLNLSSNIYKHPRLYDTYEYSGDSYGKPMPDSPCIARGDRYSLGYGTDIDGLPRSQGLAATLNGRCDIGAYETGYTTAPLFDWYVDQRCTAALHTGQNWIAAYTGLSEALKLAIPGETIRVAPGSYGATIEQSGLTLISMDGLGQMNPQTTNLGYLYVSGGKANASLKGFTLTHFLANCSTYDYNNTYKLTNCIIKNGGGVQVNNANVKLVNCLLMNNSYSKGGAVTKEGDGSLDMINCTVYGNQTTGTTGIGGIYRAGNGTVEIKNCILWNNKNKTGQTGSDYTTSSTNYYTCRIQQNADSAPLFVKVPWLSVNDTSCIDQGYDGYVWAQGTSTSDYGLDLAGQSRQIDGNGDSTAAVDIGAYEFVPADQLTRLYVDADADSAAYDGSNWNLPKKYLQDALGAARDSDGTVQEIWVAAGTYKPTESRDDLLSTGEREDSFVLVSGVYLRGGFQGVSTAFPFGEGSPSLRNEDVSMNPSILSGNIDAAAEADSYHVLTGVNLQGGSLDRFTVTNGRADGTLANSNGAGGLFINCQFDIQDCTFTNNHSAGQGGALCLTSGTVDTTGTLFNENVAEFGAAIFISASSPKIAECDFADNTAESGGAIMNYMYSFPQVVNCVFQNNAASQGASAGGAVANEIVCDAYTTNCIFVKNTAAKGGAIFNRYCSLSILKNCTLAYNEASTAGGGVFSDDDFSAINVYNSILWDNKANGVSTSLAAQIAPPVETDIFYSCVRGISDTYNENSFDDPQFIGPLPPSTLAMNRSHSDSLYPASNGCIDTGSNNYVESFMIKDIAGYKRINNECVDRGAYETGSELSQEVIYAGVSSNSVGLVYEYDLRSKLWSCIVHSPTSLGTSVDALCFYEGELYAGIRSCAYEGEVWKYLKNTGQWVCVGTSLGSQVWDLEIHGGSLYAGTAGGANLYVYSNGQWQAIPFANADWSGCSSLYEFNNVLYVGDLGDDDLGHLENGVVVTDINQGGSCIWDHQVYNNRLYASALGGLVHRTAESDFTDWAQFTMLNNGNSWELEVLDDLLYVTSGGRLYTYDGNSAKRFQEIWRSEQDIYSMTTCRSTQDFVIWGMQQTGKIYSTTNGLGIQLLTGPGGINPNASTNTNVEALLYVAR